MTYRKFLLSLFGLLLLSLTSACQSDFYIPYLMPTPLPPVIVRGVFTPADMQLRVNQHPAEYRRILDADTAILFAYPHPVIDWASSAFLIHIPSMSEVGLNRDATVQYEQYGSDAGKTRLQQLLTDAQLMQNLKTQMQAIWK